MLLQDSGAEYSDLVQHNDILWLSRGMVLERFFARRNKITDFFVAFLCDITGHLKNLLLQGRDKSVGNLFKKLTAFCKTLDLFLTDVKGKMPHIALSAML